jgi:hypothetical protein
MVKDSEDNLNKKRRKVDSSPGKTTKKPATESLTVYEVKLYMSNIILQNMDI